jgi:hypothetical protein
MKLTIKAKSLPGIPALQKLYYDSQHTDITKLTAKERIALKNTEVKLINEDEYILEITYKQILYAPALHRALSDYNRQLKADVIKNTLKMINDYNIIEMEYDIT